MKHAFFFFPLVLTFLLYAPFGYAEFSDRIQVPVQEVWEAAHEAITLYGIDKEEPEKGKLRTEWIEERVVRSSGILKKITKTTYVLNYRMEIQISQVEEGWSLVTVRGRYRQKALDAPMAARWKPARPGRDLEREFFQKILIKLENKRRARA